MRSKIYSMLVLLTFYSSALSQPVLDVIFDTKGENDGDYYGWSVSSLGDINGDGYDDVIVGAPRNDNYKGKVYIYFGGEVMDDSADITIKGDGGSFGNAVASAGDVNGDGLQDFIVAAYGYSSNIGKVHIFFGGSPLDTIPDVIMFGENEWDCFGSVVTCAGDVNGDGFDDVIVTTVNYKRKGKVYIFHGGNSMDSIPDWTVEGSTDDYLGYSASDAGDVNGDGFDDIVVGSIGDSPAGDMAGYAHIYFGGVDMDTIHDVVMYGEEARDHFGCSVSGAGDVNKDGCSDVVIGAYAHDIPGPENSGRAYIYFGSDSMDSSPDIIMDADGYWDAALGKSVSVAGDINKDGYSDVIVGAPSTYGYNGIAYMYLGGRVRDDQRDARTPLGDGEKRGSCVATAGDVNGDGCDDVIVGGWMYWWYSDRGRVIICAGDSTLVGIEEQFSDTPSLSEILKLCQNYPNPFREVTGIEYSVTGPCHTTLKIYNSAGGLIRSLVDEQQEPGTYRVLWDGRDEKGEEMSSGVYFYRLRAAEFSRTRKMLFLKQHH